MTDKTHSSLCLIHRQISVCFPGLSIYRNHVVFIVISVVQEPYGIESIGMLKIVGLYAACSELDRIVAAERHCGSLTPVFLHTQKDAVAEIIRSQIEFLGIESLQVR